MTSSIARRTIPFQRAIRRLGSMEMSRLHDDGARLTTRTTLRTAIHPEGRHMTHAFPRPVDPRRPEIHVTRWDLGNIESLLSIHAAQWNWRSVEYLVRELMRATIIE